MRILFMGTPEFAVPSLKRIHEAGNSIVGVFTQPDRPVGRTQEPIASPVKQWAKHHEVPVFSPEKIRTDEVRQQIVETQPEIIVVVAFGRILPSWILEIPHYGAVNVHASLLPRYRGAAPIQWAVANGEEITGVTTMQMDAGLDTGDILLQREMAIAPDDNAQTMHDKLSALGAGLLLDTLAGLQAGTIQPREQDDLLATEAPLLTKEDGRLDWSWDVWKIHHRVRGLNPWPGTFTRFRGKTLRIRQTSVLGSDALREKGISKRSGEDAPGTFMVQPPSNLFVWAGDGNLLRLIEVQLEGHRRMSGQAFCNGFRISAGERLE